MRRHGFMLAELLIAIVVLGVVIATGLRFLDSQSEAFGEGSAEADVVKNLVHANSTLRRDLRTAGTNLAPGQPFIVYAGADLVAFNADYASNVSNDPFSVYHDPDAPTGSVAAMLADHAIVLPGTGFTYPDSTFRVGGGALGAAETVIFFFAEDTTTAEPDDHVLYRQVNAAPPEVVARNLARVDDTPFFEYLSAGGTGVEGGRLARIAPGRLPLAHTAGAHGAPGDTMPYALVDSIRGVRVRVAGSRARTRRSRAVRPTETMIWLPNAGLRVERSCGSAPIFGRALLAVPRTVDGVPEIELRWSAAVDENGGEQDVVRYVLWKSGPGSASGDEPFISIPAGGTSYQFVDRDLTAGGTYTYRVAAQDCTPSLSPSALAVVDAP